VLEGPGARVAGEPAGVTLDLDEEEAVGREDEQVDLVDLAVEREKREVAPGALGLVTGELPAHEVEGLPLILEGAFGDGGPVRGGRHCGPRRPL
jgi:hypothetical protein